MIPNLKLCVPALLPHFLLPLAMFVGSIGCRPSKLSKPTVPKAETAPVQSVPTMPTLPPAAYSFINGTWEGKVGDPYGWDIKLDCFAQNGVQNVLFTCIAPKFQTFYFPIEYGLEGDALLLWWNDENNRGTMKLRMGRGSQAVGTFEQKQWGGPVPVTLTKTSNSPKDGAAPYHGTWEGKLGDPLGWNMRFDCFAANGMQKVLVSMTGNGLNDHFFGVNRALESDGLLLWWNDEANRATVKLRFNEAGQLAGDYSHRKMGKAQGVFSRTSAEPTEGKNRAEPQKNFAQILRENGEFAKQIKFEYDYSHPKLTELKEKYGLARIAGNGDTQSKAINLLNWLCKGTQHNGNYDNHVDKNALALLEYTYNKGPENGVNCYNLSVILSEMCLSVGIQARALWLYPANPNDRDNHVVVMAWAPERSKWIMLDPSFNAYFSDEAGNVLSPMEAREAIAIGRDLKLNQDSKINYAEYVNYMAKDMFYFNSATKTSFGTFSGPGQFETIYLCPSNFDLTEWKVKNMRFRNTFGSPRSDEELAKREESIRQQRYVFATPESFWGK